MNKIMKDYLLNVGEHDKLRLSILANIYNEKSMEFIKKHISYSDKNILEVGCGHGQMTHWLARELPNTSVIGVDISDEQLSICRSEYNEMNLSFINHDFSIAPLSNKKFDLVYLRFILLHIKEWDVFFYNIFKSLNPGAKIIIEEPGFPFFCYPSNPYLDKANELGCKITKSLGLRYDCIEPLWNKLSEFDNVRVDDLSFNQPLLKTAQDKSILWRSFIQIIEPLIALGFSSRDDVEEILNELIEISKSDKYIVGCLRLIQLNLIHEI